VEFSETNQEVQLEKALEHQPASLDNHPIQQVSVSVLKVCFDLLTLRVPANSNPSGSIFGGSKPAVGNLFGSGNAGNQQSEGGLGGGSSANAASSGTGGGIFGGGNNTGGLFGGVNTPAPLNSNATLTGGSSNTNTLFGGGASNAGGTTSVFGGGGGQLGTSKPGDQAPKAAMPNCMSIPQRDPLLHLTLKLSSLL
jgi:hypothetical protein